MSELLEQSNPTSGEVIPQSWIPIEGIWEVTEDEIIYKGSKSEVTSHGIIICDVSMTNGIFKTSITLTNRKQTCGRLLVGFKTQEEKYWCAGLEIGKAAYMITHSVPRGWVNPKYTGDNENLQDNKEYNVELHLKEQCLSLKVDNVKVLEHVLDEPLKGYQIGLFTYGNDKVVFKNTKVVSREKPKAFVITQYGEPFDSFFEEVIKPMADSYGLDARRSADVYKPGFILQDIIQGIIAAKIIIAEITPKNENVFYELGYAHALNKETILLADESKKEDLPFDIRGYRCIFYSDSIHGKKEVETELSRFLSAIVGK